MEQTQNRRLALNIPILFLLNALFGVTGVVWTQRINVIVSYLIFWRVQQVITQADEGGVV